MRLLRLLPLAAIAFAGACDEDGAVTNTTRPPLAYIRYVNAVPDTGALDFKFIDAVEYSPNYANYTFRTIGFYQGAEAGTRPVRVFVNSSSIAVTSVPLVDTTLTLVAGTYYTILHTGRTRAAGGTAQADRLVLIDDTRPAQDANVHISALNSAEGAAAFDLFFTAYDTTTLAGAPQIANIGYAVRTAYTARAALTRLAFRAAATTTLVPLASIAVDSGNTGTVAVDPVGGYKVSGTQMTAFIFSASTAGSPAPQTAGFGTPAVNWFVDRQPPRTVPD